MCHQSAFFVCTSVPAVLTGRGWSGWRAGRGGTGIAGTLAGATNVAVPRSVEALQWSGRS